MVTQQLWIIDGVAAVLDRAALNRLRTDRRIRLVPNAAVQAAQTRGGATAGSTPATVRETFTSGQLLYPSAATGAAALHQMTVPTRPTTCAANGVTISSAQQSRSLQGWGVTVAVIDSGLMEMQAAANWRAAADGTLFAGNAEGRCIVYRDFLPRSAANANLFTRLSDYNSTDQNGHGTHVISTIADGRYTSLRRDRLTPPAPVGVAPKVNLLIARALDATGAGTYGDVISAIQWVIANKTKYNVKILNLSLYAPVTGPYWADPLGQAAMKAWQAGLTVVVAAGNAGPNAGTITVPGNVPYVITVGAIKSGRYTQSGSDELAFYSSRGPTESA